MIQRKYLVKPMLLILTLLCSFTLIFALGKSTYAYQEPGGPNMIGYNPAFVYSEIYSRDYNYNGSLPSVDYDVTAPAIPATIYSNDNNVLYCVAWYLEITSTSVNDSQRYYRSYFSNQQFGHILQNQSRRTFITVENTPDYDVCYCYFSLPTRKASDNPSYPSWGISYTPRSGSSSILHYKVYTVTAKYESGATIDADGNVIYNGNVYYSQSNYNQVVNDFNNFKNELDGSIQTYGRDYFTYFRVDKFLSEGNYQQVTISLPEQVTPTVGSNYFTLPSGSYDTYKYLALGNAGWYSDTIPEDSRNFALLINPDLYSSTSGGLKKGYTSYVPIHVEHVFSTQYLRGFTGFDGSTIPQSSNISVRTITETGGTVNTINATLTPMPTGVVNPLYFKLTYDIPASTFFGISLDYLTYEAFNINSTSLVNLPDYLNQIYITSELSTYTIYKNGYDVGKQEGIEVGKQIGVAEGSSSGFVAESVFGLMNGVVNVPVQILNSLFPTSTFNFPIMAILSTFLGIGIILFLIKKFWR